MPGPLTIGLFVSTTQNKYESALYRGVVEVARSAGAQVICFTSGALRAYRGFEFQRNVLFDLVDKNSVDGIIISGTLAHPISGRAMQLFFKRYAHLPKVSIAISMPGTPYVMVDSGQAIHAIVTHLAKKHAYKRLAFLRGPVGQQEADERYQAFCDALAEYGLELNPGLVLQGDYSIDSGAQALQEFLAREPLTCDAIVSSNDSMAVGAMGVLQAHGIRIPEQVALTGFDDVEARFAGVPLTSVRQDICAQGRLAAHTLLSQIAGQPVSEKNISLAPLVVRQSCGCSSFLTPEEATDLPKSRDWPETLRQRQAEIVASLRESLAYLPADIVEAWALDWLEAIRVDLQSGGNGQFLHRLEQAQQQGFDLGVEVAAWNRSVTVFLRQVRSCLPDKRLQQTVDHLAERAYLRLGITMETLENSRQTEIELRDLALREISESLVTTFDMAGILDVLSAELPRLNVTACTISLFEDPQNPADLSRLIYAWRAGERIALDPQGTLFPSKDLLPRELKPTLAQPELVVEALYSKEDRLGFMLLEVQPKDISVTNALRALVSGALQSVLLLEQRRRTEEKLLHSQEQLQALVEKLEYANKELESFAYTVSHDLRSPLRSILGFSTILESEHRANLSEDARQLLDRIIQNTRRMGRLIDDLLAFSRVGRQPIQMQVVDMAQIVQQVLADIDAEQNQPAIRWVLGEIPSACADPALIRQVWINLITNAVKYSSKSAEPQIEIGSQAGPSGLEYFVRDNGAGFDMRYADKLFGVFQRLHRDEEFPGTGIGLAIVHRILLRHDGRIWAESEIGKGATFYFSLPETCR